MKHIPHFTKENASEYGKKSKRGPSPEKKLLMNAIKEEITYEEAAKLLVGLAQDGNVKAIEMLLDRTAGKTTQEVEIIAEITEFENTPLKTRFKKD